MRAEIMLDCQKHLGEGIFWNPADGRMRWTDIEGKAIWWLNPVFGTSENIDMPDRVCCFANRRDGRMIVAFAKRIALFDPAKGTFEDLCEFEPGNSETRTIDGRIDRQGRFFVRGMNEVSGKVDSSVIRIDPDGSASTLIEGVSCANATCSAPDGRTMFFTDTPEQTLRAYDDNPDTGTLGVMRNPADFSDEPGIPDGSCAAAMGGVWNAEWEGHRVVRVAPDGTIDRTIEVPVRKPMCCAFGEPKSAQRRPC